jgi:Recombinase/Recombinase zinc beta ribbon domain
MWDVARGCMSAQAIELEFASRGYMTAPRRKEHKPRPFDTNRILQTLSNPFYAGIVVHKGETLPTPGQWPRYVEPEDFYRLRQERAVRSRATKRRVDRPLEGFVLAELAECGGCGDFTQGERRRRVRVDGTRSRVYLCRSHRLHHRDSPSRCPEPPYDAIEVDRAVIAGIESLVTDADALSEQLLAGRRAEQERLAQIAQSARDDAAAAERAADRADQRYADALAADDDDACEVLLAAAKRKRSEAKQAQARLDAALDGMTDAAEEHESEQAGDVMSRIWHALSGRINEATGDIKKVNAALGEWFDRFELHHEEDSSIRIVPFLSAAAIARISAIPRAGTTVSG